MYTSRVCIIALACITVLSCGKKSNTLFSEIMPSQTHIEFKNDIQENPDYNILTYEYLYNGGGVAVGDINNDGLTDIMFTGNMTSDKLYLNKGNFQFEDITDKAGVAGRGRWKTGVVLADVNGDGLLDIYVCYSGPGTDAQRSNELYINQGIQNSIPKFKESAKEYGLDASGTYSTTASFFDMDNDGDLDMFLVNHADMFYNPFFNTDKLRATRNPKFGNRLYRNDNGHFVDISEQAHIDGSGLNFGLSVATSDLNNDGWTDIYVTNDYDERDFLYINNQDGTFREVLTKGAGHISEFAMGSDIADYNNDGRPDIMVLDMLPEDNHRQKLLKGADAYDKYTMRQDHHFHKQQMRNTLQLNNGVDTAGDPLFSEVGQLAGIAATDWSWAPLFADFDNDGWKDLFISNGIFKDITNLDFVKYTSGYTASLTNEKGSKEEMWQLIQQMPSTKLNNYLFKNNRNLGFDNVTTAWGLSKKGISNGAAYADLDNDGDLDLVITQLNDFATVYQNNSSENKSQHFIRIKLQGERKNTQGIGAKVYVQSNNSKQVQEQFLTRGFQSSIDPIMHIGLGNDSVIQSLKIVWPGGKTSTLTNIKADTLLVIAEKNTDSAISSPGEKTNPLFEDITNASGIQFTHQPSQFVDFKISPLLPYQLSKIGPCLAKSDINGDGLEDLFIGASAGQESVLYLQTKQGTFTKASQQPWNNDKEFTNADALFLDADDDGDMDLYLVSGGADYAANNTHYQDRFFENDGKGNFKQIADALPAETLSGACVKAADINKDGLPDLFVGTKCVPGKFPLSAESLVLKNVSKPGAIRFIQDASQKDTSLLNGGMVCDALWLDINKDSWPDLVVAGQFMPIKIFENHNGLLSDQTAQYGLSDTEGWWARILAGDFDNDGDTDLVIGNIGNNIPFKATAKEPVTITYGDFYGNGTINPVLCYYNGGKSYPYFSRDEMIDQVPSLQKRFLHYSDYSDAQLKDLFTEEQLAKAKTIKLTQTNSLFLRNQGNKKFNAEPLPAQAQISMANGLVAEDIDNDGKTDIILAGNFYPFRVQMGPLDGGTGLILKNKGNGNFLPLDYAQTGLYLNNDTRNIIKLKGGNSLYIVVANNNGPVRILKQVLSNSLP